MFINSRSLRSGLRGVVLLGLGAVAQGACSSGQGSTEPLPEGTGAIVAALSRVPGDVRCVQIQTSDYRTPVVRANVSPNESATIRIAPLGAGYVSLSGYAFAGACDAWDDAGLTQTWEASPITAYVEAGRTNYAQLTFRRPGGLQVDVDFEEPCDCDGGQFGGADGGSVPCSCPGPTVDAGGPFPDAAVY